MNSLWLTGDTGPEMSRLVTMFWLKLRFVYMFENRYGDSAMKHLSLVSILLVVVSLTFLSGCGKSNKATSEEAVVSESPETVTGDVRASQAQVAPEQKQEPAKTTSGRKGPKIQMEKVVHDFGEIGPGIKIKCEFPYKNIGDGDLNMAVQSTCGCAIASFKTPLKPGESGIIEVEYHAQILPGNVRKHLYVTSNDKENPKIEFAIKATVVQRIACEPDRLKFVLSENDEGVRDITLTSLDDRPFAIKSFTSTADCVTADIDPAVEATKFVLKAKVDFEKLKTNLRGRILISLTHPECQSVTIFFDVLPRYEVTPPMIVHLEAERQKTITRKQSILSNYEKPFNVESIISKDNSVKLLSKEKIRDGYILELAITPPDPKGEINYNTEYTIKLDDGMEIPIACRMFYIEPD